MAVAKKASSSRLDARMGAERAARVGMDPVCDID
jgi:hypothetical protein